MRYRFAAEAVAEYVAAGQFYNRQVDGLGNAFADEIEASVSKITEAPLIWRFVEGDVRRYLVPRFPYGIYYTVESDVVVI